MADDYGVKITLDGNDVSDANERQVVLDSSLVYPKVDVYASPGHFVSDTYTFGSNPGTGKTNLVSIAHGYTYTPASLTLLQFDTASLLRMMPATFVGGTTSIDAYCDSVNYNIDVFRSSSAADITSVVLTYKYMIFAEDGD